MRSIGGLPTEIPLWIDRLPLWPIKANRCIHGAKKISEIFADHKNCDNMTGKKGSSMLVSRVEGAVSMV